MTADRDTTRIVRSWLRTEEYESADRVLETVLSLLDTTPQRRSRWPSRRFAQMNRFAQAVIAAAAVLAVALVGYNLLPATGGAGGHGAAPPTPIATASPTATPAMLNGQASLGGRFTIGSGLHALVTVEAPADWTAGGDWVLRGPKGIDLPDGMAIRFYPVQNVFKNPLAITEGVFDPPVGPTAADLADAIVGDPAWAATRAADITIDGRLAKHVQFAIAESGGLGSDGQFNMFGVTGDAQEWGFAAGQTFDLYIVDVGSERVVIDAFHYPGTSASDLAAQRAVVDSIQLDPSP